MLWQEVKEIYPESFVLLKEVNSQVIGNMKYIDQVEIIRPLDDKKEATKELIKVKNDTFVYHTSHREIVMEVRINPVLRRMEL